jgi:tetratricopeptide (TPR) repeat protein
MAIDWYRKTTWTTEDETAFFLKLKRAHKDSRPQYLKLQAFTLAETNNDKLLIVALNLLEKYFNACLDNDIFQSDAYNIKGDIYYKQGKYDMALESYKNAVDFEKKYPQIRTNAYLQYSELVIQLNRTELFENIETLLLERNGEIDFPKNKYLKNSILSIIYKHKKDMEKANYYKTLAEEAANAEESVFRWHRKLGLVEERNKMLDKLMK